MSYGPDTADIFWRAASYVDRILRGEKAADLPVQSQIKFELFVNMTAAKALGLKVPESFLQLAELNDNLLMTGYGPKRTFRLRRGMSAIGGKADITNRPPHVRLRPIPDIECRRRAAAHQFRFFDLDHFSKSSWHF